VTTLGVGLSSVLFRVFCVPMAGAEANRQFPVGAPATDDRPPSYEPDPRNRVYWFLQTSVALIAPLYFRYRVRGIENVPKTGPALVVANHQSFLDPVMVGLWLKRPVRFLARTTLYRGPIIRFVFEKLCTIPLNRDAASTASIRQATAELRKGHMIGVFPEGTRSQDGCIGPLKPGFIALVRRAKVPVIPAALAGTGAAFPRGAWFVRPKTCRLVFGPPLSPEKLAQVSGHGSEEALLEMVRDAMTRCYEEACEWRSR
jgi:1-acyl-sn-glycerol-3-phosphate acyltransferase